MVSDALADEFKMAPLCNVIVLMVLLAGKIGSLLVVVASGIMMMDEADGVLVGVQFVDSVHDVLVDPFQVKIFDVGTPKPNSITPKLDGRFPTFALFREIQFSVVLKLERPRSVNVDVG